jgi:hypothetical protein
MVGTPLPFQLPPLSSSRAKQPGWCSSGTAGRNVSVGSFFLGFRVKMQPQTTNAVAIAQKIQSCICCIVVFSAARHHCAIINSSMYQVLRNKSGNLAKFTAILRASSLLSNFAADLRPGSSSK